MSANRRIKEMLGTRKAARRRPVMTAADIGDTCVVLAAVVIALCGLAGVL